VVWRGIDERWGEGPFFKLTAERGGDDKPGGKNPK